MPLGIYPSLEKVRGLPSDHDIRGWCKQLRLCIDAIHAEADYEAHTSGYSDEEEMYQELSYYDEQFALYQSALDALTALLPDNEL